MFNDWGKNSTNIGKNGGRKSLVLHVHCHFN